MKAYRKNPALQEKFEGFIKDIMQKYEAIGLGISVVSEDEVLYENYFGYRDGEKKLPIDCHTIFGMASVSKSFTAMSIMQLYERGIIDINKPVSLYIPEFTVPDVTIAHFLSHAGGFFPLKRLVVEEVAKDLGLWDNGVSELSFNEELANEGAKRIASRMNTAKMLGKPGERMSYCNDGYGILSEIVRRFGGEKSFAEYVQKNIFAPLGMTRSFCEYVKPLKDENATVLYKHNGEGKLQGGYDYYDNAVVLPGGGIVKSNMADMQSYVRSYLRGGSPVLSNYSVREMMKARQEYRYQVYYGYAIASKTIDDLCIFEHGGSLTGISSNFAWCPQLGIAVVITCNTTGVPVSVISNAAFKWFNGEEFLPKDRWHDVVWDEKQIKEACGTYHSGEGVHVEVYEKEDGMHVAVRGKDIKFRTVAPDMLVVEAPFSESDMIFLRDIKDYPNGIGAIRYGGRIIPKI